MTAAFLWVLSDNELAIYLNGGYGAEKRNQAMAIVRAALKKAAGQNLPERASEQGGQG